MNKPLGDRILDVIFSPLGLLAIILLASIAATAIGA